MTRLGRLVREPLLHFVVLGVALFALHRAVAPPAPSREILVSTALQRGFAQEHLRRHGRLPTAEETRALVDRYVDTEVMLREAVTLGLDRGDIIVRRRLVQKMEFLNQGLEPVPPPSDADLAALRDRHADRYAVTGRMTLEHVFVASAHGKESASIAAGLRERLAAGEDAARLGDPFLRGRVLKAQTEDEVAGIFGPDFAAAVWAQPAGEWAGPIPSSFGLHLVRVTERSGGRRAEIAEVRRELERDWEEQRRAEAGRVALARLRDRYVVRVEDAP